MPETLGTLNLKIAQLERRLAVLQQQQQLSDAYPLHKAELTKEYAQLKLMLYQLVQHQREFLQTPLAV